MRSMGGLALVALSLPSQAFAGTVLPVCATCTYTTFSAAATAAVDTDVIEFRDSGTYAGADVTDNITIQVQGAFTPTINTRLHIVNKTVTVVGVRIAGSLTHGVEIDAGSNVTIRNLTIENCTGAGGGGIYASVGATATNITVDTVTFQNNTSTVDGGHIAVTGNVNLSVTNGLFLADTTAGKGGAIAADRAGQTPTTGLVVANSSFTGTTSAGNGGAIYTNMATLVTGSWFTNSRTNGRGGAVYADGTKPLTAYRNVFCKNGSQDYVGALWLSGSDTDVVMNNIFVGNTAVSGAGALATAYLSTNAVIAFNDFLSNSGNIGGALWINGNGDTFHSNLVAYNTGGGSHGAAYGGYLAVSTQYSAYFMNLTTNVSGFLTTGATDILGKDPVLNGYNSTTAPCGKADIDKLYPEYFYPSKSPLIDAGDPAFTDLDGTRADIGAFGGPQADPAVWTDVDKDGYRAWVDCNDNDATSFPAPLFTDGDNDGYGGASAGITDCARAGLVTKSGDCDDALAAVNPGVVETCNKIDDDCDKSIDEAGSIGESIYYADADTDTYGNASSSKVVCLQPAGYVVNNKDCNDASQAINPGAVEICNSIDDDCDLVADDGLAFNFYYRDADVDGYGVTATKGSACLPVPGYVTTPGDCNDANAAISPGDPEVCNAIDDDCDLVADDGLTFKDYYVDADVDGYGVTATKKNACLPVAGSVTTPGDCNDANAAISPGDAEVCNAVDDDCDLVADDGLTFADYYVDADVDGYGVTSTKKSACLPVAGSVTTPGDCNDANAAISPGDLEVCNAIDDDCDLSPDDGLVFKDYYADVDVDGYGATAAKTNACLPVAGSVLTPGDCNDANAAVSPGDREECGNGVDDNCDGLGGPTTDDDGDKLTYTQEQLAKSSDCMTDSDEDGVTDFVEFGSGATPKDTDADGLSDAVDPDDDNDGVTTVLERKEGSNPLLVDSDNDLILDGTEWGAGPTPIDTNADGLADVLDEDDDGDGILTAEEGTNDFECLNKSCGFPCDGFPNYLDLDSDGDGMSDASENTGDLDLDDDGVENFLDCNDGDGGLGDNDGDGLTNQEEAKLGTSPTEVDSDLDGIDDLTEVGIVGAPTDTDGDRLIDALDPDDDGDGFESVDEIGDPFAPNDTDNDGVPDYLDADDDGDGAPSGDELDGDEDADGIPNYLDGNDEDGPSGDEDADGLSNQEEQDAGTDPLKTDSEGDGVPDEIEIGDPADPTDSDKDGTIDAVDGDDDDDGVSTADEGSFDQDGDELPNHLDTDSDGDGVIDADEVDGDPDCDGAPALLDADESDGPCEQDAREQPIVDLVNEKPPLCASSTTGIDAAGWFAALALFVARRRRRSL